MCIIKIIHFFKTHQNKILNGLCWILVSYILIWGAARLRYEIEVDKIENKAHEIAKYLTSDAEKMLINRRIAEIQTMKSPLKPEITNPLSILRSFYTEDEEAATEQLKKTLEECKDYLSGLDLRKIKLQNADLRNADLRESNLRGANLSNANLREADLREADLRETVLKEAWLREARLECADLSGADLKEAILWKADFLGVYMREAENLTVEQLCQVKTLCGAMTDPDIEARVRKRCPGVFDCPDTAPKPPATPPRPINKIHIHNRVTSIINTTNIK